MLRRLGDYSLRLVTKEVITVRKFNRRRRLENREKLSQCSTVVGVDNACRDVVCRAQNLSRLSKSVVLRFELLEADVELVEVVEVGCVKVV